MSRFALRASLLDFVADPTHSAKAMRFVEDGLLIIDDGKIVERGEYSALAKGLRPEENVTEFRGCIVSPGFIDTHVHMPQIDVIASPARGLLEWLQQHTYPCEARFGDAEVADDAAAFFLDELARHGTTSACVLGSVQRQSIESLFTQALARNVRMIGGQSLMDRNCPDELRRPTQSGMLSCVELAGRWHGRGRLGYAVTPRFAATSSPAQLKAVADLLRERPDLHLQTHLAENQDEVALIRELFPQARSYLDVYDRAGLLREVSIFAHCIWLDERDRLRMAQTRSIAAVCASSNLFLGSGLFDFAAALGSGMRVTLATDVGGGQSLSMLETMKWTHAVARLKGHALRSTQLWFWATRGAAEALGWSGKVGALEPGYEADLVVLDPAATPILQRRTARAQTLEEKLFALIVLGDDRAVVETFIAGRRSKGQRRAALAPASVATVEGRTGALAKRFGGRINRS